MRQRVRRAVASAAAAALMGSGAVVTGVVGANMAAGDDSVVIENDFESTYAPWGPRGPVTLAISDDARTGAGALAVTGRTAEWNGPAADVAGLFEPGGEYQVAAWVKLPAGAAGASGVHFTVQETSAAGDAYTWVGGAVDATADGWVQIGGEYTMPDDLTAAQLYVEAAPVDGAHPSFLVDDLAVTGEVGPPPEVQDLLPIKDTVDFPVGVAIDERETTGAASELLLKHFDQITPENHMKPEAWYDEDGAFRPHPQAVELMDYAAAHDLRLYGHVLVWHSQTPEWFFQAADGTPLTSSEADQGILRERLRTHIFSVAQWLSDEYGAFGDGNPLTAFDVVNEVVNDGATSDPDDGLRRSEWYRVLGEGYIDLAFEYADEAFNDTYAAPGADRPVALFINDYNTEQSGKQDRYHALVERLIARGVPVDGVGHQFHVSLSTPVSQLSAALERFEDLPVTQAVTELDVTIGTPETQANLVEQGYWFRDAFRMFRAHAEDLYSVTVWGLTDGRSWRADSGAPLVFDDDLQAKPAYDGAVDGEVPPRLKSATVFAGDVPLDDAAATSPVWDRLPRHPITADGTATGEPVANFQLRWAADHLTAHVAVTDGSGAPDGSDDDRAEDAVTFDVDGTQVVVTRDGTVTAGPEGATAVVAETDGGYVVVAHLPLDAAAQGDVVGLDVQVSDGATVAGWNTPGTLGTLTLFEELSYLEVAEAVQAPEVDGAVDDAWSGPGAVSTDRQIEGDGGATATVRTLWSGDTLYVLAEVADPEVDVSGSDPWVQDSVEIFVDGGNAKNGSYRDVDTQIRISADNVTSFGTGDEAEQAARLTSATARVDGGYVVEAAVDLLGAGGADTFQGLDFQVNDGTDGARTAVRAWADPSGTGYQSTARWGVGRLVAAQEPEPDGLVNTRPPAVVPDSRGTARGAVLVADPGEWVAPDGERVRFTYRWLRDGEPVDRSLGAVTDLARLLTLTGQVLRGEAEPWVLASVPGSTYLVGRGDVGRDVSVEVTAHARGLDDVTVASDAVPVGRG